MMPHAPTSRRSPARWTWLPLTALVACDMFRGPAGASAYDIWLADGHTGTESDFLAWLRGADGEEGSDGSPGADGSDGSPGAPGADGLPGADGAPGVAGQSAYELWLAQGYSGTEADFLAWLQGLPGPQGPQGEVGPQGPQGEVGPQGPIGPYGAPGQSAYDAWLGQGYTGTLAQYVAWQQAPITEHFGGAGWAEAGPNVDLCYIGTIHLTAGPVGEGIPAAGQLLPINNYIALFALLGTTYGGDGVTTFALPDLRDVAPQSANGIPMTYTICDQGIFPARY